MTEAPETRTDDRIDRLQDRLEGRIDRLEGRIDRVNDRIDRLTLAILAVGGGIIIALIVQIVQRNAA